MTLDSDRSRLLALGTAFAALTLIATSASPGQSQIVQPIPRDSRKPISSLPFTIDHCGSYFLTRCLTGQSGSDGITIAAAGVTLDLNGFTLTGVAGSLNGISVTAAGDVCIKNGHVRSWGAHGITATVAATRLAVTEVSSSDNTYAGINIGRGIIARCTLTGNMAGGISAGGTGIGSVLIRDCRAEASPAGIGFSLRGGANVRDCSAEGNQIGFRANDGVSLRSCTALNNDCGILLEASGAAVLDCSVVDNTTGIHLDGASGNRVDGNALASNASALVVDGSAVTNWIVRNTASGNGSNYTIAAGNSFGPIVVVTGVGNISGTADADHPWANFVH